MPLFAQALLAFLALPGVVAFAVPVAWLVSTGHTTLEFEYPWALALLIAGTAGLLWCVRDFYVAGKGTLAPWSPPQHLVVVGLFRFSRNPIYVSVTLILLGWAAAFALCGLFIYAIIVAVALHLRVVFAEEPWLARTHGAQWEDYKRRVPRWFF